MRIQSHFPFAFGAGMMVGLGMAGVAIWTMSGRRAARLRIEVTERSTFIDGVHPPNTAELDARPAEEATASARLESEAVDMSTTSQRW